MRDSAPNKSFSLPPFLPATPTQSPQQYVVYIVYICSSLPKLDTPGLLLQLWHCQYLPQIEISSALDAPVLSPALPACLGLLCLCPAHNPRKLICCTHTQTDTHRQPSKQTKTNTHTCHTHLLLPSLKRLCFLPLQLKEYELSEVFNIAEDDRKYETVQTQTHLDAEHNHVEMNNELSASIEMERQQQQQQQQLQLQQFDDERQRIRSQLLAKMNPM